MKASSEPSLETLEEQHRELDKQIDSGVFTTDSLVLSEMKRKRLRLKDEIERRRRMKAEQLTAAA